MRPGLHKSKELLQTLVRAGKVTEALQKVWRWRSTLSLKDFQYLMDVIIDEKVDMTHDQMERRY